VIVYVPGVANASEKSGPDPLVPLEALQEYVGMLPFASGVPPAAVTLAGIVLVGTTIVELPTVLVADMAKIVWEVGLHASCGAVGAGVDAAPAEIPDGLWEVSV
jgi:hypothetical protein